jgi:hypothetical protein
MASVKSISVRLLRELIVQEKETVDWRDPYQLHLFIWNRFVCVECGRESDFSVGENLRPKGPMVAAATLKARAEGWHVRPPADAFLTSEAYCAVCAAEKRFQQRRSDEAGITAGEFVCGD